MIVLKNCSYLSFETGFTEGDIAIEKDVIAKIGIVAVGDADTVVDLRGAKIIPGLIDIHFHGTIGYDVMEASPEELKKISSYLVKKGTTSYMATTITSS